MWVWDYKINKHFKPQSKKEWEWFLIRKINYGDFKHLNRETIKKYFHKIKAKLDPGKKMMLENFLK